MGEEAGGLGVAGTAPASPAQFTVIHVSEFSYLHTYYRTYTKDSLKSSTVYQR